MLNKNTRLFLIVACSSVASQIYVNLFVDGFIFAMSPFVMGVLLYIFRDINPIKACVLTGIFSPLFRLFVMILQTEEILHSMKLVLPDIAFFFAYAFFFGIVFKFLGLAQYHYFYLRLVLCDFFSNCAELSVRIIISDESITLKYIGGLVLIALMRSLFIILICMISESYKLLLEKKEHDANYKRLLMMASTFNSEMYFMQKNTNDIEDIMGNAFTLYRTLEDRNYPKELQSISLGIAKDIHEVKKGNTRVIKGLQDFFNIEFKNISISLEDLLKILSVDLKRDPDRISFMYSCETDYMIEQHFDFMSILRNLISNSIDALEDMRPPRRGEIYVSCKETINENIKYCIIEVKDNGPGIPDDVGEVLFVPGFSTKFNENTGDINRGLGLTLVKDLTEKVFKGNISFKTSKSGTTFRLQIPVSALTASPASKNS